MSLHVMVPPTMAFCLSTFFFASCSADSLWMHHTNSIKKWIQGTFLAIQWLRLHLSMQGAQVQSLVGELRSHMSCNQEKKKPNQTKTIKQKQYCNKFNKSFKKKKETSSLLCVELFSGQSFLARPQEDR